MGDATACQAIDEELSAMMSQLESLVAQVRDPKEITQRKLKEPAASAHIKLCKRKISELKTEAGKLENPTIKEVYLKKVANLEANIKANVKELKDLITPEKKGPKVTSDRERIMGDGGATGDNFTSASQVLSAANRAQDDNLEILRRTRVILAATEEVGTSITETLQKQREEVEQINKDLGTLQSQINRAKGDLMWFARQMAGDKCFMCLLAMVILALLVLVGWKVYDKRNGGTGNVATTAAPASPGMPNTPPAATPPPAATTAAPPGATTTAGAATTTAAPGVTTAPGATTTTGSATTTAGGGTTTTSTGGGGTTTTAPPPTTTPTTTAAPTPTQARRFQRLDRSGGPQRG